MSAANPLLWNNELIRRYDLTGARYTSYPTALEFTESFTTDDLAQAAAESRHKQRPLSLYLHIPFCARLCYYCACNKVVTKRREKAQPYLDRLYQEIQQQSLAFGGDQRPVNQLHLGGGTPTFLSNEQLLELREKLQTHFRLRDDDQGDYSIEIDPREVAPNTMAILRGCGFNRLSLGVQDLEPVVQKAINRVQDFSLTRDLAIASRELGFRSINFDLIYGLPHQTEASFARTLEQVLTLQPDRLSVFNYAHLPHRFQPQTRIAAADLPAPDEKLRILQGTINRLLEAGYVYIGMDHFAKPEDSLAKAQKDGTLHRNFQGYTTHGDCDLIGLGVSAIGQTENAYFQNHHDMALYEAALDRQVPALVKGRWLSEDDRIRRWVINQLICHFKLSKKAFQLAWQKDFNTYFSDCQPQLKRLQADNLISQREDQLLVSTPGRLLIRAICQVFDRYQQQLQAQRIFSRII